MTTIAHRTKRVLFRSGTAILLLLGIFHTKSEITMEGLVSGRFATIRAVAEQSTFAIDGEVFRTVDRVVRNGKVYSDKPPMLPFLAGMLYKGAHLATGVSFTSHYYGSIYFLNLLIFTPINLLIFLLLFRRLLPLKGSIFLKGFLAFSVCAGTWLYSYSVVLNNHTPAALLLFVWFLLLEKTGRTHGNWAPFCCGLAAAGAGAMEIPVGLLLGGIGLVALWRLIPAGPRRRVLLNYLGGGLALAAANTLLNYAAFGTVVPLYLIENGTYDIGFSHQTLLVYGFELLFGRRGLFSYQPLLLFALPLYFSLKRLSIPERALAAAGGAIPIFYWLFTNEYGGWAYGFRYAIAAIPAFGYLAARYLLPRCRRNRPLAALAVILALVGFATAAVGAYSPYANIYENDDRSPPGSVHSSVRSSFAGNLLAISFERAPDGFPTRQLFRLYGEETALRYLKEFYINTKNIDALFKLTAYVERHYPVREP